MELVEIRKQAKENGFLKSQYQYLRELVDKI